MTANAVVDALKSMLTTVSPDTMIRLQIGANGSVFEVSAADLSDALGVSSSLKKAVKVTPPFLRVRAQPGTAGQEIVELPPDTILDVIDIAPIQMDNHQWLPTADKRGWVAADLTVPVTATATASTAIPQSPTGTTTQNVAPSTSGAAIAVWTPPFHAHQRGVGASAGGWAPASQHLSIAQQNAIEFVLVCAYESGQAAGTVPPFRNIGVKSFILRACTHEKPTTPERFVDMSLPILNEFVGQIGNEPPIIAIGNEPNISPEGWQSAWNDGASFATWWLAVASRFRQAFPSARLGFPAMSPGGDVPNLRMNDATFISGASAAIQAADWIGVHYYWTDPNGGDINPPISQWRQWFGNKPIIGTEVGPADATTVTPGAVQIAYQKFAAVGVPACAWLLTGSGAWHNAAWDEHNVLL